MPQTEPTIDVWHSQSAESVATVPKHSPRLARFAVFLALIASPVVDWPLSVAVDAICWHVFRMGGDEKAPIIMPIVWGLPLLSFVVTLIARSTNTATAAKRSRRLSNVALGINIVTAFAYIAVIAFMFLVALGWNN